MKLSARNQLAGTVTAVTEGPATAVIEVDVNGSRVVSSITREAAAELGITEGSQVTVVIKASDVMLGIAD